MANQTRTTKTCPRCKIRRPFSEYHKDRNRKDGLSPYCKVCRSQSAAQYHRNRDNAEHRRRMALYYAENRERQLAYMKEYHERPEIKEKRKNYAREYRLRKDYGLTPEQYDEMVAAQNGNCAICGENDDPKPLHVDHCHETGVVRGLLCYKCNTGIGIFNDSTEKLRAALAYLGG